MHTFINDSNYGIRSVYDWKKKEFIFFKIPDKLALPAVIILASGGLIDASPTGNIARSYYLNNMTGLSKSLSYYELFSNWRIILSILISSILLGLFYHFFFRIRIRKN